MNPGITIANRTSFIDCGSNGRIKDRIADCSAKNGANSTWDGPTKGAATHAVWKLVSRIGANQEVWQDQRTGLFWSSLVSPGTNWCKASGNVQAPALVFQSYAGTGNGTVNGLSAGSAAVAETLTLTAQNSTIFSVSGNLSGALPDATVGTPYLDIKGNFTINAGGSAFVAGDQFKLSSRATDCRPNSGTSCSGSPCQPASPVSYCHEDGTLNPPPGENWGTGTYFAAKGGMGMNSATAKIRWRLPTTADYDQAEIDGIRFVLPSMVTLTSSTIEYTASQQAGAADVAWVFVSNTAALSGSGRSSGAVVRCVGR